MEDSNITNYYNYINSNSVYSTYSWFATSWQFGHVGWENNFTSLISSQERVACARLSVSTYERKRRVSSGKANEQKTAAERREEPVSVFSNTSIPPLCTPPNSRKPFILSKRDVKIPKCALQEGFMCSLCLFFVSAYVKSSDWGLQNPTTQQE